MGHVVIALIALLLWVIASVVRHQAKMEGDRAWARFGGVFAITCLVVGVIQIGLAIATLI